MPSRRRKQERVPDVRKIRRAILRVKYDGLRWRAVRQLVYLPLRVWSMEQAVALFGDGSMLAARARKEV